MNDGRLLFDLCNFFGLPGRHLVRGGLRFGFGCGSWRGFTVFLNSLIDHVVDLADAMVGGEQGGVWDVFENSIPQGEEVHVLVQQLGGVRKLFAMVLLDLIDEGRQVLPHELLDLLG